MGFAEEELQIAWKKLRGRILSGKPSAKCPSSCIITEKGGHWVGVFLFWVSIFSLIHTHISVFGRAQSSRVAK